VAKAYRKGACENCGAMGHARKDCLERPRKVGARFTNQDIRGDDRLKQLELTYDGKRDRWNGFDGEKYREVERQYQELDQLRKKFKTETGAEEVVKDDRQEYVYEEFTVEEKPWARCLRSKNYQQAPKNLRSRQDVAKYLINRDVDSAHFDPKSRAMQDDPDPSNPNNPFRGEKSFLNSGDMLEYQQYEAFAFEYAQKHGLDLNVAGLPTLTNKLFHKTRQLEKEAEQARLQELEAIYGATPGQERDVASTELYVEYLRDGRVKQTSAVPKSRYPEDIHPQDHSSVWGSWWN
jgi:pre-mRNA-processing factor SLU7